MNTILQDIRYALRILRKAPGFTAIAVLTLTLGIGANTAIFSLVNSVLLKSLPFRDAGQLVAISETYPNIPEIGAATADLADWQQEAHSFQGLAGYTHIGFLDGAMLVHGAPEEVHASVISHNLFSLLGIQPALGRNFLPEEDQLGRGGVAILSGQLWKRRFGADSKIIGEAFVFDGKSYTVIGILPPGMSYPADVDVWFPLGNLGKEYLSNRFYHPLFVVGRMHKGVTVAQARAEMMGIAERLARAYPGTNHNIGVNVAPLRDVYVAGLNRTLLVAWCAVALVMLIACANVASLLLSRAARREAEMAVRAALGATRLRLIQQSLTESFVLACCGAAVGLLLAEISLPLFASWLPKLIDAPILHIRAIEIDTRVLAATVAAALVAGAIFGVAPAWRMSGEAVHEIRPAARASAPAHRRRSYRILIASEIALAVMVLISAGLLVRSLQKLLATSPGFRADHLLTMRIVLPAEIYSSQQAIDSFYARLLPRVRALAGVESAATISETPLVSNTALTRFLVDDAPPRRPGDYPVAHTRNVSPNYLQSMNIPLLKGRLLTEADLHAKDAGVLVINRTLAREFFPGQDPIGRKLDFGVSTGKLTAVPIVGVVGDVRDLSIASPAPAEMYFAGYSQGTTLVVRTALDPAAMAPAVRRAVLATDPAQPVYQVRSMDGLLDESMARQRISAVLLGAFSLLALLIAAGGIYGVTAYGVAERTREIGIRMSLGAQPRDVLRLIVRQEMLAAGAGLAAGIAASFGATRLLSGLLYGIPPGDPLTYLVISVLLGGVAVLACYIPARRAMKVDPMVSLRYE